MPSTIPKSTKKNYASENVIYLTRDVPTTSRQVIRHKENKVKVLLAIVNKSDIDLNKWLFGIHNGLGIEIFKFNGHLRVSRKR